MRTRRRRPTPESGLKRAIVEFCHWHRVPIYRLNSGKFRVVDAHGERWINASFEGCPDLFALLADGRTLWIETKATTNLSEAQMLFRDYCQARGVPHVVARSVRDLAPWIPAAADA
jgi:hypothetical protein